VITPTDPAMLDTFTELTTHDLWVEARQFELEMTRPSADTVKLTVRRPSALRAVDGAVILLSTRPFDPNNFPVDGRQYANPSQVFNQAGADAINNAQVVAFYSGSTGNALPTGTLNGDVVAFPEGEQRLDPFVAEFAITVTNTDPNTVYYASVHAASNVLQYFPLGIQSYPLDATGGGRETSSYTGSIPSLPGAPTSPTPGMVYFDQQLNLVQYWDSTRGVWIPTRTDSIISGDFNPGLPGQAYLLTGNSVRIFDGKRWVSASQANLQLRQGVQWIPLNSVSALIELPAAPQPGDLVYSYTSQRVQYWDGLAWQIPTPSTTLFSTGTTFIPAFTTPFSIEPVDLITPYIGLLFYNLKDHALLVWGGAGWEQVNTAQAGVSTTNKIGIGDDGTYESRLRTINNLKSQLGWPALCIELSEEQFNVAIDNALDTYRQLCIGAYEQKFMIFTLMKDQAVYYLNSQVDRTDAVVTVMKVHRLNLAGATGGGPENVWGQAFAQNFYNMSGGGGDLLSSHLVHAWSEEFNRIFAGDIPFIWNEARRELTLKRAIRAGEKVVLEVELERSEQELLQDRWCKQFLQNWALAECKEYLGLIRTKYSSGTPGPAGSITLNGDTLLAEARQDFAELKQGILDYEYQNAEHGNVSFGMF